MLRSSIRPAIRPPAGPGIRTAADVGAGGDPAPSEDIYLNENNLAYLDENDEPVTTLE